MNLSLRKINLIFLIIYYKMSVDILGYPLTDLMWPMLILIKNTALGTASVGLAIGACLLSHFLFNLSRLPKKSR